MTGVNIITRDRLVEIIDAACWQARKTFGHDDNGLTDVYGDGESELEAHPSAIEAAETIIKEWYA